MSTPTAEAHMPTTISIPEELADELYDRKGRGESYADVIWQLIDEAESGQTASQDTPGAPVVEDSESRREPADATHAPENEPAEAATFMDHVDAVADETLPGSGAKLEDRREAFHTVVEYLRESGTATPAEFRSEVYPEHKGWYTDGKDPARSWWKNAMYPALAELAERTDALAKADHTGEWRWRGAE
jgi:hypothetical protein